MTRPNRRTILAPLFAVLAILLGVSGSASGAFNHAATEVHYEDFLLWETKALGVPAFEIADPTRGNGEWVYDDASGVLFYVRQNPWTMFDPLGLSERHAAEYKKAMAEPDSLGSVGRRVWHGILAGDYKRMADAGPNLAKGVKQGVQQLNNDIESGKVNPVVGTIAKGALKVAGVQAKGTMVVHDIYSPTGAALSGGQAAEEGYQKAGVGGAGKTVVAVLATEAVGKKAETLVESARDILKKAPKTGTTRHVELEKADNGAYFGMLENGEAYVGKGGTARARKSLRKKSRQQDSPVDDIAHYPEPDDVSAFKKEAELINDLGGVDAPGLLNKINSPGKKK